MVAIEETAATRALAARSSDRGRRRSFAWPLTAVLTIACTTIFIGVHTTLVRQASTSPLVMGQAVRIAVSGSLDRFLAIVVASVTLVAIRRWRAALITSGALAFAPILGWMCGVRALILPARFPITPNPLGYGWTPLVGLPDPTKLWLGAGLDWFLALLPAVVVFIATRRTTRTFPGADIVRHRSINIERLAAWLIAAVCAIIIVHTHELLSDTTSSIRVDTITYAPLFFVGAYIGFGRWWKAGAVAAVPVLWSTSWVSDSLLGHVGWINSQDRHTLIPFLLVVVAGASVDNVQGVLRLGRTDSLAIVGIVNGLNILDAAMTTVAVRSGQAAEANPVVTWIGFPLKIVLVAVASIILWRVKPRALIWLAVALFLVGVWHASGAVLNIGR